MARPVLLQGKKFGKWKVLNEKPHSTRKGYYWNCKCECGTIKKVNSWELRKGTTKSCGCSLKLPEGESVCRWLFRNYKKQARELPFELTLNEFKKITKEKCYYCDTEPKNKQDMRSSNRNGVYIYNGIDRVNNLKGYTKENVVPCCKVCNSMKGKLSQEDFFTQVGKILKNKK